MKLSKKSEYACLAMMELSRNYGSALTRIEDISENNAIPRKYLEQILLALKHVGYLRSRRGVGGGYELTRPPSSISLAEIVRLMDGPLAPVDSVSRYFYSHSPIERCGALLALFQDIRDMIAARMEGTTFADLVNDSPKKQRKITKA